MISLIIKDGLGNQLFQYAYARYLQYLYEQEGKEEKIAINSYYIDHFDFRKTALHNFVLNSNVEFMGKEQQKKDMNAFKVKTLLANGFDIIPWKILKTSKPLGEDKFIKRSKHGIYYTYRSQTEFKTVLAHTKNKYVFGFFQGEWNFAPIKDIIRKELEVKTEPSKENLRMLNEIDNSEAVCLHIRRGDYLDPRWKNLQVCTFDYYNNAINIILEKVENPVFFVFSNTHDDIEWIKENYHFTNNVNSKPIKIVYVDLNNPDYEELRLMMHCKNFIISNSTFSWWGAYLSQNENKTVLVPQRWNLNIENDESIYLSDWIKVPGGLKG